MKNLEKCRIIQQCEKNGEIIYQSTLSGDYKSNNKAGKEFVKIYKIFEKDRELATACIIELINSDNVVVRSKAASYCLALKQETCVAEKVLDEISKNPANGIFGFNAKVTLDVWREKGELLIYKR